MNQYDVLVTGAEERQGLAVVRALGSRGIRVLAAGLKPKSIGFYSRQAAGRIQYPSPAVKKREFANTLLEAARDYKISLIIPVVESTVIAVDEFREILEPYSKVALPSSEILSVALDKKQTYSLAQSLNIDIPQTTIPDSTENALSFARKVNYPIVIKPRSQSSYSKVGGAFNFKVKYAADQDQLRNEMVDFESNGVYPILQEYCKGTTVAHSLLCADGKILGIYQHRRGRDYPLTGGVASVVISEEIEPDLLNWTQQIMRQLKWDGVAQIEYRRNRESGRKVLFEINARFWAPVSAAAKLGLNFPVALYDYLIQNKREKMQNNYPVGQRCRYLRGDLFALESYLFGDTVDYLTPLPSKSKAIFRVLKDFGPHVKNDVASWNDPLPAIFEFFSLLGRYGYRIPRYFAAKLLHLFYKRN